MQAQTLTDRKRAAVRRELTALALDLFVRDGYAQTTVDAIADAAGMSRRTFFRYYATKEEVVIGKWDAMGDDIIARFSGRDAAEDRVASLRAALDVVVEHYADPASRESSLAFDQIIASSPQLSAAFLYQVARIEQRLTEELVRRDPATPRAESRALVGAAGACLIAAMEEVLPKRPSALGAALDRLFGSILAG